MDSITRRQRCSVESITYDFVYTTSGYLKTFKSKVLLIPTSSQKHKKLEIMQPIEDTEDTTVPGWCYKSLLLKEQAKRRKNRYKSRKAKQKKLLKKGIYIDLGYI